MRARAGSGVTSIELLLDADADARVRADWRSLADAGMSSLAGHTSASNSPHVTLLARTTHVPHPLELGDCAARAAHARAPHDSPGSWALPLPLVLSAPMLFGEGDRRVLVRAVAPSDALLALHRAVLAAAGDGDDPPHLLPGRWVPHVTLARRLRLVDVPRALELLGPPIDARGVEVRRWDAATTTVSTVASAR